jgi:flagellar basal-body rod modification protein FlgD
MSVDSLGSIQANREKYAAYFEKRSNDTLSVETFYKLLISEMKNQNPLEPMSNTEFVSQLASFSALQNQSQSLYYANASYASSLVGKTVTVARSSGSKLLVDTGVVESLQLVDGEFMVSVNGKQYTLANIMTIDANTRTPTDGGKNNSGFDGAYAVSLIGKYVTVEAVRADGTSVVDQGSVSSVEVKNGVAYVVVNNMAYKASDVVRVQVMDPQSKTT